MKIVKMWWVVEKYDPEWEQNHLKYRKLLENMITSENLKYEELIENTIPNKNHSNTLKCCKMMWVKMKGLSIRIEMINYVHSSIIMGNVSQPQFF